MFGLQLASAAQNWRDLYHIITENMATKPTLCLLISYTETSVCQSTAFQNSRFVMSILRLKPVFSCGGFSHFSPILQSLPITEMAPPEHSSNHLYSPHWWLHCLPHPVVPVCCQLTSWRVQNRWWHTSRRSSPAHCGCSSHDGISQACNGLFGHTQVFVTIGAILLFGKMREPRYVCSAIMKREPTYFFES